MRWGPRSRRLYDPARRKGRERAVGAPRPASTPPSVWATLWRCAGFMRPYWRYTAGAYLGVLCVQGLNVAVPQLLRWGIDGGVVPGDRQILLRALAALIVVAAVRGVFSWLHGRLGEIASQRVACDMRDAIHRKLTALSFSFHDTAETGELIARSMQDVDRIRFLSGRATLRILEGTVILAATAAMLFWMQPTLAALVTLTMPLLVWQAWRFGRRHRPLAKQIQRQLGAVTTEVEQSLRGSRVVKTLAREPEEIARFERENARWFDLSAFGARLTAVNEPLLLLLANAGVVLIVWYGGALVIEGALTVGELVAFVSYVVQLVNPVRRLGMMIPAIAIATSAAERVFEVLDIPSEVEDRPDAHPLAAARGHLRFEGVSFVHPAGDADRPVLQDIDLEVLPGQVVAVLGPTGSGKSSLVSLVPRFYEPTRGRVTLDGHDLRDLTLRSLRRQIGIVMQELMLFAGTVRENIAFGRPEASDAEVEAAARAAQAHDFITATPHGYATRVGERGVTLSGGQRQRIAIARALLMDPRILILDDATASVDTETESQIRQALATLMQGRTTLVVAHRASTVQRADLIVVLDGGRITARGTHDELLRASPAYAEVFRRQR